MDILDFTMIELQRLVSNPDKIKQYVTYLDSTPCVFMHKSKERLYIDSVLGNSHKNTALWNKCLINHLDTIRTLKSILVAHSLNSKLMMDELLSSKRITPLFSYLNAERELLNSYFVNKAVREKTKHPSCFHTSNNNHPTSFPVSLVSASDNKKELTVSVNQIPQRTAVDYADSFTVSATTNLETLLHYPDDRENLLVALKKGMSLQYILDDYCEFKAETPLPSNSFGTLLSKKIAHAFFTIGGSYGLRLKLTDLTEDEEGGWSNDKQAFYSIAYFVKNRDMEKMYMQRLIDCNNTLIFSPQTSDK
jgi:hypothetical protein